MTDQATLFPEENRSQEKSKQAFYQKVIAQHNQKMRTVVAVTPKVSLKAGLDSETLSAKSVYMMRVLLNQQLRHLQQNSMSKNAPKRLFMRYLFSEAQLKSINASPQYIVKDNLLANHFSKKTLA